MKYLVTGGTGFIGSALVRRLAEDGHEVTVLARGYDTDYRLSSVRRAIHHGDVRDPLDVAEAATRADRVVHLAYPQRAQRAGYNPREVLTAAVHGMAGVLDGCRIAGVRDLLVTSSPEAYLAAPGDPVPETVPLTVPDPLDPRYAYGAGKIASEVMAGAALYEGLLDRLIIARPHNVFGPDMGTEHVIPEFAIRMGMLDRQQAERVIAFPVRGTGGETRAFCFIDDCVSQLVLLLDHATSGIWNAGSMEEHTVRDVAETIAACYGRDITVIPGQPQYGGPDRRLPDTGKIEALGWDPASAVPFADAVGRTVAWYRDHG